ncbi:hypothetical protein B0H10DRAFT_1949121 [Mycena sp. CBHHK59/15]|nr:hypothetical protein B0H10DRAFT_1949121 [Mycena sp. CBHHK59/15]
MPTPKRSLQSTPSSEPPKKRRHTTGTPSTPYSYPYIPSSSSTPYPSCPSDSPSNPFGRTRTWNLIQDLPPPTSFSKHLPLRFQFLRRGTSRRSHEGIYRVVQVPQSYTLVHLKSLIAFLFGGAYGQVPPDADDDTGPGHMFEIKHGLSVYSSAYKPGQIKRGLTWAYSSSILDPYLYCPDWETEDDPDAGPHDSETEEKADDERKWTAEEDMTIAHAWPEGGDMTRGIIYQHSPDLQVHITINTTPIKTRRGRGNLPHVFTAVGLVYLDAPSEDDELEEEDPAALLAPSNWNEPEDAFATYYAQTTILPFAGYETAANSSSASVPSLGFSSSPLRTSSSSLVSPATSSSARVASSPDVIGVPKYTPAPRPAQRKRIRHLQRRIGQLTRTQAEDEERKRTGFYKPRKKPAKTAYEDREQRECSQEL